MRRFPRQNSAQLPRSWFCNFYERARCAVLVILNSYRSNRGCIGGNVPDFKFRSRGKMHSFRVCLAPWNKAWLEYVSCGFCSLSVGDTKASFRAKASTALVRRLVIEDGSAYFARFFHALIITQCGLGTVTNLRAAEREFSMPSLFDILDDEQQDEALAA